MPFHFADDYWLEIPGGKYTTGLLPDEARALAQQSAEWAHHVGPEPAISDWKNAARYFELQDETGNVEYMTQYLLAHYPAREVELEPFAIARRPVLNSEYRAFLAEVPEFEPDAWSSARNTDIDLPARGITWIAARSFAEWAGARLPFEAEWERAARGGARRLFPWGNSFRPVGELVMSGASVFTMSLDAARASPDGLLGLLDGANEWCADLWDEPPGLDLEHWGDKRIRKVKPSDRCTRGAIGVGREIPSLLSRKPEDAFAYANSRVSVRLVRADKRAIPIGPPPSPGRAAMLRVRSFEAGTLLPTLRSVDGAADHEFGVTIDGYYSRARPAERLISEVTIGRRGIDSGFDEQPEVAARRYCWGPSLVAVSRETVRRVVPEHGIYVWNIQYRLALDGRVHARPVVIYRMAFNGRLHQFEHRFRPHEVDTPIDELTPELILRHIHDSFWFYDRHADDDQSPF